MRAIGPLELWEAITRSGLFSVNELRNCAPSGPDGTYSQSDVADFCRKKSSYKLRSAVVVADVLDAKAAARLTPVTALLTSIATTPA